NSRVLAEHHQAGHGESATEGPVGSRVVVRSANARRVDGIVVRGAPTATQTSVRGANGDQDRRESGTGVRMRGRHGSLQRKVSRNRMLIFVVDWVSWPHLGRFTFGLSTRKPAYGTPWPWRGAKLALTRSGAAPGSGARRLLPLAPGLEGDVRVVEGDTI